ncbi:MAG: pyruvate dehydrogenase complex dihydrolipoamide acetyltransferase [Pseudomonadota bacterium]|nr:pyruvate dehydrogenase complex dihydrolipoamide acetyltransferase [Pseudomonadota bacterium]MEC7496141.1 pyruvate dehydrogenase complex dihydrolipoamide acetyltransferase [Pseudomonadota bacterium]
MAIDILMPALSPTMETGTLAKWTVAVGDAVRSGDVIAEIETDKATMEVEAVDDGILASIMVAEGSEGVAVGTPIGRLAEDGESPDDVAAAPASSAPVAPEPAAAPVEAPTQPTPAPVPAPAAVSSAPANRIFASPLARRIAADRGVDLASLSGSGPHGRILRRDVEAAETAPAAVRPAVDQAVVQGASTLEPNSQMRRIIASRLQESKQTAPHFYLTVDCEIDALLAARRQMNDQAPEGVKISVNDLVIRAAAMALIKVPKANASWEGENTRLFTHADIAMAVAVDGGLVTPVIWAAEKKGLAEIASVSRDLATRARDGKLAPEEFTGGSFTISNLGMYGVREFAAVINPPQGAILAVGAGEQRPVVKDGQLAVATVMTVTLSADHRVVDGAVGAEWLQAFKGYVEAPVTMLL